MAAGRPLAGFSDSNSSEAFDWAVDELASASLATSGLGAAPETQCAV